MLEILCLFALISAFAVTTLIFLKLYRKISSEIMKPVQPELDEKALEKLREALSRRRGLDLRNMLNELREVKSEIEAVMSDEERRDFESERGGDS